MLKRIVCFFKGHKWKTTYRKYYKICGRCEKIRFNGEIYPAKSWLPMPEKEA
jgi:hypothetical protein